MYIFLLLTGLYMTRSCAYKNLLFSEAKSWSEAQIFCREKCVDLTTVHDMREMKDLLQMTEGQYDVGLWIGLYKGIDMNWQWSLADESFYKEGERSYFSSNASVTYNCMTFTDGVLGSDHCTSYKYAICFDESKQGLDQYVLSKNLYMWMEAREHCRANYTDMASVRNAAEAQMIISVAKGLQVWVGLFKDRWIWSDNSSSSFRFFIAAKQPFTNTDPMCVAMVKSDAGRWHEMRCNEKRPFLCKCPRSFMTLKVALNSDKGLNLHNPVAQENIINQIELKLNTNLIRPASLQWVHRPVFVNKSTEVKGLEYCRKT